MSRLDNTATELSVSAKYLDLNIVVKELVKVDNKSTDILARKVPGLFTISEYFENEQVPEDTYPIQFKLIQTEHQKEKN
eukprot:8443331-Ditylum_brightwellii.AAC.1